MSDARAAAVQSAPSRAATPLSLPRLERLGSEHGLSHNSVYAVLEDRQGFLWFGTQSGLNRYDGRDFVVFGHDPTDPRSLGSSWINTLFEDRAGRFLVGTRAGLYRLADDASGFESIALDPKAPGGPSVTALVEQADGTLWVGADGALYKLDPTSTRIAPVRPAPGADAWGRVRALRVAPDGAIWALDENVRQQSTLVRLTGSPARFAVPHTWAFGFTESGAVWLDPRRPVEAAALGAGAVPAMEGLLTSHLRDLRGRLWVGTLAGLRIQPSADAALEHVPLDDLGLGALTHEITTIVEDRVGSVWLGTFGGVLRFDPNAKPFAQLVHREGDPGTISSNAVSALYQEPSGTLWVASFGAGLDEIARGRGRIVHHSPRPGDPASLCGGYIWDIAPSRRGGLWLGSNGVFCRYAHGRFTTHPLPDAAASALSLRETKDGTLWLATMGGLYRRTPGAGVELVGNAASGLFQPIDTVREDGHGRLWLASGGSGNLAWYDPATRAQRLFRGVGREGIWDLDWDPSGTLWLATGVGVASYDSETGVASYAPSQAGAAPAVYYSVLSDPAGRLWLGTSRGLVRYDPSTGDFRSYDVGEGTGHVEFNRHAAYRSNSGELFFGSMSGVTSFVPTEIRDNPYRPPIVLTGVRTFGDEGERRLGARDLEALVLSPRNRSVWFEFAALNLTDGRKNRYAYRLDGFDTRWIDAGPERSARYTSLPAGQYVFRVRGSNSDGVWSDRPIALGVTVLPPVWQTWWFRLAGFSLLVGALYLAHRLRTGYLVGLERLRLRIASDLHDDLGSELSGIALASGLVARQPELREEDRHRLAAVIASAVKVMDGLRDIIWCISPDHDTLESMELRMRSVARTLLVHLTHEFRATGMAATAVEMGARRHLFLIYKELLHNIVRHAHASHVAISLDATHQRLCLEVADNGSGMSSGPSEGRGIKSIRRRVQEIGADLRIDSTPGGGGTTVCVVVHMPRTRRGEGRGAGVA